jgi:hypothetical protein
MRLKYFGNKGKQWLVRGFQAVEKRVKTWCGGPKVNLR